MAFLNNSGDIILDAVLTDLGRKRLSQGDGTFKITQFALGDDEIDYSQYNISTGSAYQDLDILQTPILEAISDNVASMKSKLVTYSNTNLLYLPISKLNVSTDRGFQTSSLGTFNVMTNLQGEFQADTSSFNTVYGLEEAKSPAKGTIFGRTPEGTSRDNQSIVLNQGLDTTDISFTEDLSPDLADTSYFVYMDNRLGRLLDRNGDTIQLSYIDDDNIATYVLDVTDTPGAFIGAGSKPTDQNATSPASVAGPYNNQALKFSIFASDDLVYSDFLFQKFGNTSDTAAGAGKFTTVYSIDTELRVVGATTGYQLSIPVRFVKIKAF